MTPRLCPHCSTVYELERDFPRDRTRKSGYFPYCKQCQRDLHAEWYQNNPEKARIKSRRTAERNKAFHNTHPLEE